MSVGLIKNTISPAEMILCRDNYKALEEKCKSETNIQSHLIAKGKRKSSTRKLLNGKIQFTKIRVSRVKLLSKILSTKENISVSKATAELAKREAKKEQSFVM